MVVLGSVAMAPVFPHQPKRKHRGVFLLSCSVVAAAVLLFAPPSEKASFVGISPPFSAVVVKSRVVTRGEAETIDVEPEPAEPEPAPPSEPEKQSQVMQKMFQGKSYTIKDGTYTVERGDGSTEEGKWNVDWEMPQSVFERREPALRRAWKARARRLRIKHGKGQKRPNGRAIYLEKMLDSPFTREIPGYEKAPEWRNSEVEVERRAQQKRAHELKKILEQKAEEVRIARLRELGVSTGEPGWRQKARLQW